MADRNPPYDIDPELEGRLAGQRNQIAYPEMADSVSSARQRIESAERPLYAGTVTEPIQLDSEDDTSAQAGDITPVIDIGTLRSLGRTRQALTLIAASLAIFIVGGLLIVLLPDVINDDQSADLPIAPAVLGQDTTGYRFAGTIGGPMIPNEPVDVAVDSQGNIYAADIATRSVHKFDPEGAYITSWTADDAEVGAFIRPWSITVEADTIYVLDQRQDAIYELDTDGNVLDSWRVGDPEDDSALFFAIEVNQHGQVYVTNANGGTIDVFEGDGTRLASIQVADDPQNGGNRPFDVAVAADGTMYVTDFRGDSIRVFDTTGAQIKTLDNIVLNSNSADGIYGVTLSSSGELYVRSLWNVARIGPNGEIERTWSIEQSDLPQLYPSSGVAVTDQGLVLLPDSHTNRIVGLTETGDVALEIKDDRPDHFAMPGGMHIDDEGSIFVADSRARRVTKLAPNGTVLDSWTWETDIQPRTGFYPGDIAMMDDHLYILDGIGQVIVKLTLDGKKVNEWTGKIMGDDMWGQPSDINVDASGNVLLGDWADVRVLKYDENGEFLGEWPSDNGGAERQDPQAMYVLGDTIYVAYILGSKPGIWTFDMNGNVIEQVVEFSNTEDQVDTVTAGLAVAQTGDMFTVDPFLHTVRWYSPSGELKSEWELGSKPRQTGGFVSIAISDTGTVYVSDGETRQILVYEPVSGDADTR